MAASPYTENSGPNQDFAISRGEICLGCLLSQDSALPKGMSEVSSRWLLLFFHPESPEALFDRLTEICGMMKWEELIFPNRSLFLKGKRWRHQKASYPLQVKKEDLYQQYLLSFQVHLWWHILNTVLTNMSPNFSLYFKIRVIGEGLHLVQPVYITQVLVSYLLFPFHLWKDERNVNKTQDFHIS